MPSVKLPIPNSDYSVARSAVMSVVEDLKQYTYMGKDVNILFPNDSELVPTKGSTINDTNRKVQYLTAKTLHVEVQEDTDPEFMLNVHTSHTNNAPVFYDKDVELSVHPIYYRHSVTLTIKFRSDSRSEVINWRNGIKTRLASGAQFGLTHTLQFHFYMPGKYVELIKHIHDTKEANYPTAEDFTSYYKRCSGNRLTSIHDPNGAFKSIVIQESQSRVLGIYELSEMPDKPEKDADTSTYVSTLTYKFSYMKPEYMYMKYPVSVYNELLPEKYVAHNNVDTSYRARPQSANLNVYNFKKFEQHERIKTSDEVIGFVRYPYYDDTPLVETFLGYKSVASFLVSLDDKRINLLNLAELGDFHFNEAVMKFIREVEWKYMNDPYKSVFSVSLQKKNKIKAYHNIVITEDLDVNSRLPLDIRDQHRVVFDICYEWYMLDRSAIDRLLQYPDAFAWVLESINRAAKAVVDNIKDYYKHNDYQAKRNYTKEDFDIAIAIMLDRARDETAIGHVGIPGVTYNDILYTAVQGNNIFDRVPPKLIQDLMRTAKKTKTVYASAIIAKRQKDMT